MIATAACFVALIIGFCIGGLYSSRLSQVIIQALKLTHEQALYKMERERDLARLQRDSLTCDLIAQRRLTEIADREADKFADAYNRSLLTNIHLRKRFSELSPKRPIKLP